MIRELIDELIKAGVSSRDIFRNWEILKPIGGVVEDNLQFKVIYQPESNRFEVYWYRFIGNVYVNVEFDLVDKRIIHSTGQNSSPNILHTTELTEANVYEAVKWFYFIGRTFENYDGNAKLV